MVTDLGAYAMSSGWIQLPVNKEPRVPKFYLFGKCIITSTLTKKGHISFSCSENTPQDFLPGQLHWSWRQRQHTSKISELFNILRAIKRADWFYKRRHLK